MPRLIIYVPFPPLPPVSPQGDIRANAQDVQAQAAVPFQLNGIQIDTVVVVYRGEEAIAANQVMAGDTLVVHGHGGPDGTDVSDNLGANISQNNLMAALANLHAANAGLTFFAICYSGMAGHIGPAWHALHQQNACYGTAQLLQGALAQITRQGTIRNAMFKTDDHRMALIP